MSTNDDEPIQLTDEDSVAPTDDELLANAIPIEGMEEEEPEHKVVEVTEDGALPTDLRTDIAPIDMAAEDPAAVKQEIRKEVERRVHDEHWKRSPNVTGTGAIHVKTFFAKLRPDAIGHMDNNINEWLDAHPEYEVKLVSTTIGDLVGKTKEKALFVNVWV
jgi:hypothetical protein